jgi:hypothetical protein
VTVKPDCPLWRIGPMTRGLMLARALRRYRQPRCAALTLAAIPGPRTLLEIATRSATLRLATRTRTIATLTVMPWLLAAVRSTSIAGATVAARPLSRRTGCLSPRPAVRTTIGGRASGSAGTAAMRRFHYSSSIALTQPPAQPPCSGAVTFVGPGRVPSALPAPPGRRATMPPPAKAGRSTVESITP